MAHNTDELEYSWLENRWGKFTASTASELESTGKGEMFGIGAKTRIKKVAREAYTQFNMDESSVNTKEMMLGKMREPISYAYLYKLLGVKTLVHHGDCNPLFHNHIKYPDDAGCSPDILAYKPDGSVSFGVEMKNPKGDTHQDYLFLINNSDDLRKKCFDYWVQCQFSMACYGVDLWLWTSHNEYFPQRDRMLIVEVPLDKTFQDNFDIRLQMAIRFKKKIIEQRINGYKGEYDFKE